MNHSKAETVVHADHEVITPSENLKSFAQVVPGEGIDESALERAAEAIASLEGEFGQWMQSEVDILVQARAALSKNGPTPDEVNALYRAAHDIRGQGATFGFPLAGDIADNLCYYIDACADPSEMSMKFIDAHIDAIVAILREDVRDRTDPTARAVLWGLTEARKRFAPGMAAVVRTVDPNPA